MAFHRTFTAVRATPPHWPSVLATLRQIDPSVGLLGEGLDATIDKDSEWTAAQVNAVQNAINTAPADTPQIEAQNEVDALPLVQKATVLTLLDLINESRAAGSKPLPAITPSQLLAAIRAKAGSL